MAQASLFDQCASANSHSGNSTIDLSAIGITIDATGRHSSFKHGLCHIPEYRAWQTMRLRCQNEGNKAFKSYGARGITVCERWKEDFLAFLLDMGRKPSPELELDRIDNDKGYEPGNCRWTTRSVNDRNRRNNRWVEFRGERRLLIELCQKFRMRSDTVRFRIKNGWSIEEALMIPPRRKSPNGFSKASFFVRTKPKVTEEQRARAREMRQEGKTYDEIAEAVGVSDTEVGRIIRGRR